jgi:peptide chain release factor 2
MKVLKAKLLDLERQKHVAKLAEITGDQLDANFGSQIRSYVLHPYQQVKDLRSGVEIGNVEGVLDGDLDTLMEGYLQWERASR